MARIGVYSVESTELEKPPAEREYEQKGVYLSEQRKWADSTDDRIQYLLPSDEDGSYSIEDIQAQIETTTLHVYFEDDVPGKGTSTGSCPGPRPASD